MRLRVPSDKITELHPADLAEIISDLTRSESDKLLESLDVETVAETLEEVEPEFQAALVETMPDERVADVLEEMSPDAAADLLAELPEDRSEDLLNLMEQDEAADVRKLLSYPIDTAGGLMTTSTSWCGPISLPNRPLLCCAKKRPRPKRSTMSTSRTRAARSWASSR